MYRVTYDGGAAYADSIVLILLHANGSYVPCADADAGGFCAKCAAEYTDDETGETRATLVDRVFQFAPGTLRGDEPVGAYTLISGATELADADAALAVLYGEET